VHRQSTLVSQSRRTKDTGHRRNLEHNSLHHCLCSLPLGPLNREVDDSCPSWVREWVLVLVMAVLVSVLAVLVSVLAVLVSVMAVLVLVVMVSALALEPP